MKTYEQLADENQKLHKILDDLTLIHGKIPRGEPGYYKLDARDWYAMHCLLAFAPEPDRSNEKGLTVSSEAKSISV